MFKHCIAALLFSMAATLPAISGGATVGNGVTGTSDSGGIVAPVIRADGGIDIGNGRPQTLAVRMTPGEYWEPKCQKYNPPHECDPEGVRTCRGTVVYECRRTSDKCNGQTKPHWVKISGPGQCQ